METNDVKATKRSTKNKVKSIKIMLHNQETRTQKGKHIPSQKWKQKCLKAKQAQKAQKNAREGEEKCKN